MTNTVKKTHKTLLYKHKREHKNKKPDILLSLLKEPTNRVVLIATLTALIVVNPLSGLTTLHAQSLKAAMAQAYVSNPTLKAGRAELRAIDEGVAQARSGYRPNITLNADAGTQWSKSRPGSIADGRTRPRGYSITLNQPIFRGLRTVNSVRQADDNVLAGRERLRNTEQTILLRTVTAYMDVVRDQAILKVRKNNTRVLAEQLKGTKDRFDVGEVTRTDVARHRPVTAGPCLMKMLPLPS